MKLWRFAGFDDSFKGDRGCIFGCVMSGSYVEGLMFSEIEVDGLDATEKIVGMLNRSKFAKQIKCIFLPGITFGGFNVADIRAIWEQTGIPVVVVMRRKPRIEEFKRAAMKLHRGEERMRIIERAGEIHKVSSLYVQLAGITVRDAEAYIEMCRVKGSIPEPLRIAHLAASAVIHGESKGKV